MLSTVLRMNRVVVFLAIAVLGACDASQFSEVPSLHCVEPGTQCQLPEGPLGVCESLPCLPGQSPPCFRCTSQH